MVVVGGAGGRRPVPWETRSAVPLHGRSPFGRDPDKYRVPPSSPARARATASESRRTTDFLTIITTTPPRQLAAPLDVEQACQLQENLAAAPYRCTKVQTLLMSCCFAATPARASHTTANVGFYPEYPRATHAYCAQGATFDHASIIHSHGRSIDRLGVRLDFGARS